MKKVKNLFTAIFALILTLGLGFSTVLAAEPKNDADKGTGTITVTEAVKDKKYSIYRLLDLESTSGDSGTFSYVAAENWKEFFRRDDVKKLVQTYELYGQIYVTFEGDDNAAALAQLAKSYATAASVEPVATETPKVPGADGKYSVTFNNLKLGYYLIDTTTGTICGLTTTNNEFTALEKNNPPTVDKKVQEDKTNAWGDTNDADLGQVVNYKTTITAYEGAAKYVLHDTMTGLTLVKDSIKVKVGEDELTPDEDYKIELPTEEKELEDKCTFEVHFTDKYLASITRETKITVTYSGTVNPDAVIAGEGNPNTTKLTYGDGTTYDTVPSTTTTFVWKFDILKYTTSV